MVPKSKQTESVSTEYLRQARIVWRELISIAKGLPRSPSLTETRYACRADYDLIEAAAQADGIHAMTAAGTAFSPLPTNAAGAAMRSWRGAGRRKPHMRTI